MADRLERAFLAELEALEKFRISYTGLYPSAPLAQEDPDVRRLMEALAMFTARTRLAAERNLSDSMLRVFRQYFPFLVSPVPSATMLRARVTPRYVDVVELPAGTRVYGVSRPSPGGTERVMHLRSQAKLRLLPVALERVDIHKLRPRGWRLLFRFAAGFPRNDEIGDIQLYVNHLNDLASSLSVLYELRSHLVRASVVFDGAPKEDAVGAPCQVAFGAPDVAPHELEAYEHPLQRARAFFHFPQRELFARFRVPPPPNNWREFTVCLDVDDTWPTELRLTAEAFQLHVVPVVNVARGTAEPIEHDGTKERHPVLHPDRGAGFVPCSIHAVYKKTDDGLQPLEPAALGTGRECYELFTEGADAARRAWIGVNLPDAFENPERLVIEAFWTQPALAQFRASDLRVRLADRFVDGVEWTCMDPLAPQIDGDLADARDDLMQLVSLKGQRFLGAEDLVFVLRALGAARERPFAKLASGIADVHVTTKPYARKSAGFKHVYDVEMRDLDASDLPRLDLFSRELLRVLTTWCAEEVVELVVRVPNLDRELHYA
jgi:type VI secretion system protein ImpG